MICPNCQYDGEPYRTKEIGDDTGRALDTWHCPKCDSVVPAPVPASSPVVPTDAAPAQYGAPKAPQPPQSSDSPLDVLKAARARRRWLATQLKQAARYRKEFDQLTRLLDAAGSKRAPRAPKG